MDNKKIISIIKEWISPFLLLAIIKILWTDLTEMKSDIKILLGESKIYKTEIDNLKTEMSDLKDKVYAGNYKNITIPKLVGIKNDEEIMIKDEKAI